MQQQREAQESREERADTAVREPDEVRPGAEQARDVLGVGLEAQAGRGGTRAVAAPVREHEAVALGQWPLPRERAPRAAAPVHEDDAFAAPDDLDVEIGGRLVLRHVGSRAGARALTTSRAHASSAPRS